MTYENAYEILSEVRRGVNEYSTAYVQGTDTSGAYSNAELMLAINSAQKYLWDTLITRNPQLFYKSTALTPASNELTMPSDFYRIRRLENADGLKMHEEALDLKLTSGEAGSEFHYYWKGGKIVIDHENYTQSVTLYYVYRPRELDQGMSSAGGALSLTLATTAKKIADYYNSMLIENVTDDWVDTISDYSAARVCTLAAQTGAASKYYGLVSDLPEMLHPFIARKAVLFMKDTHKSLKSPTQLELNTFMGDLGMTIQSYLGTANTNMSMSELFK